MATSRKEQELWVTRHRASGQSLKSFCRDHKLSYSRVQYWVAQYRKRHAETAGVAKADPLSPGFMQLSEVHAANTRYSTAQPPMELHVGASRLVFGVGTDPKYVADLIREVAR